MPIRDWQIWNEPNLTRYWSPQPFAKRYVRLLKASRRALRAAGPGLADDPGRAAERELDRAAEGLQAGGRGAFDAVALHPYTGRPRNVIRLVELARQGDAEVRRPAQAGVADGAVVAGLEGKTKGRRGS